MDDNNGIDYSLLSKHKDRLPAITYCPSLADRLTAIHLLRPTHDIHPAGLPPRLALSPNRYSNASISVSGRSRTPHDYRASVSPEPSPANLKTRIGNFRGPSSSTPMQTIQPGSAAGRFTAPPPTRRQPSIPPPPPIAHAPSRAFLGNSMPDSASDRSAKGGHADRTTTSPPATAVRAWSAPPEARLPPEPSTGALTR